MSKIINPRLDKNFAARVAGRSGAREKYEMAFHKKRALFPTRMSSGVWVWNSYYWVRYTAMLDLRKSATHISHYLTPRFAKGKVIEKLSSEEMTIRKLMS